MTDNTAEYIEVKIYERSSDNTTQVQDNIKCYLNVNDELSIIRKRLEEEPGINMGTNMYFKIGDSRICGTESRYRLSDILVDRVNEVDSKVSKMLKLIRHSDQPDWRRIIKDRKLEYGIKFTRNGPERAKKKAF